MDRHWQRLSLVLLLAIAAHVPAQDAVLDSYLASADKASAKADLVGAEKFLKLAEREAAGDEAKLIQIWNRRALLEDRMFKYADAESHYKQALSHVEQRSKGKKEDRFWIAHTTTLLANHYRMRGRYDDAEPLYRKALAIREKLNGPNAWETAQLMRDVADLHRDAGRLDAAEPIYRRAITTLSGMKGREYHLAFCLANLGELLLQQDKFDEAEALCRQALSTYDKVKGDQSFNRALCLATLGEAFRNRKKVEEAAATFADAIKRLDPPPAAPVRLLPVLKRAAAFYRENGRVVEAKKLEAQIKEIEEKHKAANAEVSSDRQP